MRIIITLIIALLISIATTAWSQGASISPHLHYTPNGHYNGAGEYEPAKAGFNIADVSNPATLAALPDGSRALIWIGQCNGADSTFTNTLHPYTADNKLQSKIFGFYLMDEPDPTGKYFPKCTAENLKAESDWIHEHFKDAKTFFILMNQSSSKTPTYDNTYTMANTHVDLFGIDPYPCRTELKGCDYSMIENFVRAVEKWGIPADHIVPVYQAFGGGDWTDDGSGKYLLPTADETRKMMAIWKTLVPNPVFDYAYSWGSQKSDQALESSPELQAVYAAHNRQ